MRTKSVKFNEAIAHLVIDRSCEDTSMAERFRRAYPRARVTTFDPGQRDATVAALRVNPKSTVVLTPHKGRFVKPFPRHKWYQYDHMYNLILGFNCHASCHYCFVHTYFDDPCPTMYANDADVYAELRSFLESKPDAWISTGEFIDSLQLDRVTRHTERIMETMRDYPAAVFELRTKHSDVEHLPDCPHPGVLVSFSINPETISRKIEAGSADLDERLRAARQLIDKGYRVAFRLDPIIAAGGYLDAYAGLAETVEATVSWKEISRVFLGVLRFDATLMRRLAGGAATRKLLDAEYVRAPDGKYRVYKNARVAVYRELVASLRKFDPELQIELVMEPDYVSDAALASL